MATPVSFLTKGCVRMRHTKRCAAAMSQAYGRDAVLTLYALRAYTQGVDRAEHGVSAARVAAPPAPTGRIRGEEALSTKNDSRHMMFYVRSCERSAVSLDL